MRIVFYLTKYNTINDAVKIYLNIIHEALVGGGKELIYYSKIRDLKKADILVTYYVKDYFVARVFNRNALMINWFQGILPEESLLWQKSKLRYFLYSFMEWYALATSKYNFFVSEAMLRHYQKKYNYKKDNYFIMPCFNAKLENFQTKELDSKVIEFVYIGSLSAWQCIDETLETFKCLNSKLPNARLTILTKDVNLAHEMINQQQVENVSVDYVPLERLSNYLLRFKYGFLIRKDIEVNNVATPNKLNTYMASGVIPIYSNVIDSFKLYMRGVKYQIPLIKTDEVGEIVKDILLFEGNVNVDYYEMHAEYSTLFELYYNEELYKKKIRKHVSFLNDCN